MTSKLPPVARVLLGLVFVVFGLNGFFRFLPMPPHPGAAGAFLGALAATGYMFPLLKTTEVLAGVLLLSGRLVPFALTLLAPVLVNIAAFHFVLEPQSSAMVVVLLALEAYLAWTHRAAYAPLFQTAPVSPARPVTAGQPQAA